jgi:hypothetical protein
MPDFPFIPTNATELEEGMYWDIFQEGRFGFAVVIGRWNRVGVLAGILTLIRPNNTIEPGDQITVFQTGYVDVKSIKYCMGMVRGQITPPDLTGLIITNRTLTFAEPRAIVKLAIKENVRKKRIANREK